MANTKKNYWYVLVMAEDGPAFVTSVDNLQKMAHWNKDEKPLELGKSTAENLAFGLRVNFFTAFVVSSKFEIKEQPYNYKYWDIEWKPKEENK
jgi:hypothetical protein